MNGEHTGAAASLAWYASAADLFAAARSASRDIRRTEAMVDRMREECGMRSPRVDGSRCGEPWDSMGPVDRLMDYEALVRERMAADAALVKLARRILYGIGGDGGVAALLSPLHADAVCLRYLCSLSWERCGEALGYSQSHARRLVAEALDVVDAVGFDAAASGVGIAEA